MAGQGAPVSQFAHNAEAPGSQLAASSFPLWHLSTLPRRPGEQLEEEEEEEEEGSMHCQEEEGSMHFQEEEGSDASWQEEEGLMQEEEKEGNEDVIERIRRLRARCPSSTIAHLEAGSAPWATNVYTPSLPLPLFLYERRHLQNQNATPPHHAHPAHTHHPHAHAQDSAALLCLTMAMADANSLHEMQRQFLEGRPCDCIVRVTLQENEEPCLTAQERRIVSVHGLPEPGAVLTREKPEAGAAKGVLTAQLEPRTKKARTGEGHGGARPTTRGFPEPIDIPCHAVVLCARSPFFSSALGGGCAEARSSIVEIVLDNEQMVEALRLLLKLNYTRSYTEDESGPLDDCMRLRLAVVADRYGFGECLDECIVSLGPPHFIHVASEG